MTRRLAIDGRELESPVRTGIGRYVEAVLRAASRAGWDCLVYGTSERLAASMPGVTVRPVAAPATWWWDQVTLPRRLKRDGVSVFLSPYYKAPLSSPCPVVVTIHDLYFIDYPGAPRPLADAVRTAAARLYARRAEAIITDSEFSKRGIVERLAVHADKIRVIPIAADPRFRPATAVDDTCARYGIARPYVLYVGNFKPHKNLPRLLQAHARLEPALGEKSGLVLAGGDAAGEAELARQARELGLSDRVRFLGVIPDEDLPGLYRGAALLVLPSLVEGFGLPALEAMQCGTPVAASNRGGIPEVVGDAAVLFDPEDVDAIAAAMTGILGDEDGARDLARRGLTRAAGFSAENTSTQVLSVLDSVSSMFNVNADVIHEVRRAGRNGLPSCPCGDGPGTILSLGGAAVLRCRTCGLLSRRPLPPAAELDAYYRRDYWARYEAEQDGPARQNLYAHALDWIERFRTPPGVLVDVGCGPGALLALGRDRGWDPIGVEPSASAVARARARGFEVVEGPWLEAGLKPASADVVTFINVLDHLTDPFAALQEARRVLRPGGLVYVRVPNAPVHAWLMRVLSRLGAGHLAVLHLYGFGRRALRHHLSGRNFSVRMLRAAPPSQQDAYRRADGRTGSARRVLKALNGLGYRAVTAVGLDRHGWGLALEAAATKVEGE